MSAQTSTLWRPTSPDEWTLVKSTGFRRWPPPEQPIFHPVLNEDYAGRIARDWNVKAFGMAIATRFDVERDYLDQFERTRSEAR